MSEMPFVSVVIPCRNEKSFIEQCLDSIISNSYPKDKLEVLVVDGNSQDGTKDIIQKYCQTYSFIHILDNQQKIVPTALNIGIQKSTGEIMMRMDAHTQYEKEYISKCVKYLKKYDADNVGGICITLPWNDTPVARTIASVLSHPFGVGNAYFRIGSEEPKYVDTVPFGCYKREVFEKVGLFNESLIRNQDIEFNLRLKKIGGKILLVPDIISYYRARSNFRDLFKQHFWNGFWVIYSWKFAQIPFSIRHLVPLIFVLSLATSFTLSLVYSPFIYFFTFIMGIYLLANLSFSLLISINKGLKYLPFLVVSFLTLHFSYGLGSIWGIIRLALSQLKKPHKSQG